MRKGKKGVIFIIDCNEIDNIKIRLLILWKVVLYSSYDLDFEEMTP